VATSSAKPELKGSRESVQRATVTSRVMDEQLGRSVEDARSTNVKIAEALAAADRIKALADLKSKELEAELMTISMSLHAARISTNKLEQDLAKTKALNLSLSSELSTALARAEEAFEKLGSQEAELDKYRVGYPEMEREIKRLSEDNQKFYELERSATKKADKNGGYKVLVLGALSFLGIGFLIYALMKGAKPVGF
jgi:chromosome segregation ATPase